MGDRSPADTIQARGDRDQTLGSRPRIVHLSTTDSGGAARAALRIHRSLSARNVDSRLLVAIKRGRDDDVESAAVTPQSRLWNHVWPRLNALALRLAASRPQPLFTPSIAGFRHIERHPAIHDADVVALYWAAGFIDPGALHRLEKPIIWRLSDTWPFTGGCHYPGRCDRFRTQCGMCPVLGSGQANDLALRGFVARSEGYRRARITVVAPSTWIARLAGASALFRDRRIVVVPTGVDTGTFKPQSAPRPERFGLDPNRITLLIGAADILGDRRKGFLQFADALRSEAAAPLRQCAQVLMFGNVAAPPDGLLPLPYRAVGMIRNDDALAEVYGAADILVIASTEDNLPQVALEGLACGLPLVGAASGGLSDALLDGVTGTLVPPGDSVAMASALVALAADADRRQCMSKAARQRAEALFSLSAQGDEYVRLINDLAGT